MDTQIYGFGPSSGEMAQVDPTTNSLRVTLKPTDYSPGIGGVIGGHYHIGAQTGTMTAGIASGADIFHARWADPTRLFCLLKLTVQCATLTGFAATSLGAPLDLFVGHGSTANGSGGAALAPNSISNRLRNSMNPTAFSTSGEIRVATTGALTAPTGNSYEPASLAECMGAPNATLVQSPVMYLFETRDAGAHPLVLVPGDSLFIRTLNPAATGTWVASISMEWIETVNL